MMFFNTNEIHLILILMINYPNDINFLVMLKLNIETLLINMFVSLKMSKIARPSCFILRLNPDDA